MMPSQTGSTPCIASSGGATIGTTTKMISKASITKPSRNIASITARIAPAGAARQVAERAMHHVVAAEPAEHQAEQRRADQDDEDHAGHLRGPLHHRASAAPSVPLSAASKMAPTAPTEAASVGVAMPVAAPLTRPG